MKKLFTLLSAAAISLCSFSQLSLQVGATAPDWTVTDIHGHSHNLYDITASGKIVIIDFFFRNCGPCQGIAPTVTSFYQKYGCNQGDVFVISMSDRDDHNTTLEFETLYSGNNPAPAVSATPGGGQGVAQQYGPSAFPTVCLIGTDNKIKNNDIWPISGVADIESAISGAGFTIAEMSCTVGMEENEVSDFTAFPNPSEGNLNVAFELNQAKQIELEVYDILGAMVYSSTVNASTGYNNVQVDLNNLQVGNYILKLSANGEQLKSTKVQILK